ncbi:flagellar protein FlgN [Sporanaerobacter acetigenes]|uniref:FlgN protein n=1 Tax=Sporanaerobacter acetigenes DSM 13106 TaxID=1123281 RepID=A0A1M5SEZ6_9FIRM|nr:flagellar protein FlgN [Sporanaerobacter acetigenes]SHH37096.1 FlgN protein [Sporanaerobacter acetigenes DSM 13106]
MEKNLVDEMIRISNEKLKLLNVILDLTKLEREYIDKEDMDKINGILDEKDNVINRIDKLNIQFLTCFSQLKKENNVNELDELEIEDYPNLKELKEVVIEIKSTFMAISLIDDENNKEMAKGLEKIKANLKSIKKGQKAYKGYNKTLNESILIDEKK